MISNISNKFCSIMKVFCVKKRQNKRCMTKFFTRNLCYLQKQHFIHNYHKILKHFFNSEKSCHMYKMIHTIFIIANSCDIRTHHFLKLRYRNKWGVEILIHSFVAIAEKCTILDLNCKITITFIFFNFSGEMCLDNIEK